MRYHPLQYQGFFGVFATFRKLVINQLIWDIKTQNMYQMKDIVHGYLQDESIFEINFEKMKKSDFENPIC